METVETVTKIDAEEYFLPETVTCNITVVNVFLSLAAGFTETCFCEELEKL